MINPILRILLLLPLLSVSHAANDTWQLQRKGAGIQVSQQATHTGLVITRGSLEVNSSISALVALMRDNSACRRWLHACRQSRLITTMGTNKRLDYTVVDSPYLYADRDMYVYSEFKYNRTTKTVTVTMSGRAAYDKGQAGRVRIKDLQGFWRLQKLSDNKTAMLYQIYSNPQLAPSKYLNNYLVGSVFQTLTNLSRVSKEAKYRNAHVAELR